MKALLTAFTMAALVAPLAAQERPILNSGASVRRHGFPGGTPGENEDVIEVPAAVSLTMKGHVMVRGITNMNIPFDYVDHNRGGSWTPQAYFDKWMTTVGAEPGDEVAASWLKNILAFEGTLVESFVRGVVWVFASQNTLERTYAVVPPFTGNYAIRVHLKGDRWIKPRNKVFFLTESGNMQLFNDSVSSDRDLVFGIRMERGKAYGITVALGSGLSVATHTAGDLRQVWYSDNQGQDLPFFHQTIGSQYLSSSELAVNEARTMTVNYNPQMVASHIGRNGVGAFSNIELTEVTGAQCHIWPGDIDLRSICQVVPNTDPYAIQDDRFQQYEDRPLFLNYGNLLKDTPEAVSGSQATVVIRRDADWGMHTNCINAGRMQ